jgi:hypothetical protein
MMYRSEFRWLLAIFILFQIYACREAESKKPVKNTKIDSINIFLDNSVSMAGYIHHNTALTRNVSNLITELNLERYYKGRVNAYTICNRVDSFQRLEQFVNLLTPTSASKISIGQSSPIDSILDYIISNLKQDQVYLFITDAIVSGSNVEIKEYDNPKSNKFFNKDNQTKIKNRITSIIDKKSREIAIKVLAYRSDFVSAPKYPYYKLDNNASTGSVIGTFKHRPYYIFILCNKRNAYEFEKSTYPLFRPEAEIRLGYGDSVFSSLCKLTNFYIDQSNSTSVDGDQLILSKQSKSYHFGVLMNMPLLGEGLKDKIQESVVVRINNKKHSAQIKIFPVNQSLVSKGIVDGNQWEKESRGYTHLCEVTLRDYLPANNDRIGFSVENDLAFVKEWGDMNDLQIGLGYSTTFGFESLIKGMEKAFPSSENHIINLSFQTKLK